MSIGRTFIALLVLTSASVVFAQTSEAKPPDVVSSGTVNPQSSATPAPNPSGSEANALVKAEILTDTMGADFGPYMTRVTKAVRQNWYSIMPPSVYPPTRKQGELSIGFGILKDGKVTGMLMLTSSGDVALDRAAWGSITASTFPPLPTEFPGQQLRLHFHYFYNPSTDGSAAPVRLELGKAIEDKLYSGVPHYFISLKANQYVRIVYSPPDFDTFLALELPGELNGLVVPGGTSREELCWVAKTSGQYGVLVAPKEKITGTAAYEITLAELRPAVPQDQDRITAQNLLHKARTHALNRNYELAIPLLGKALKLSRNIRDHDREIDVLSSLGGVYAQIGQPQKALEFYNQALPILREVGDRRGEATTLKYIGLIYGEIGQPQKQLELLNQALPIEREVGDRSGEAIALTNIGVVYEEIGQPQKALEFFNQAFPILREVGEAKTLNSIGVIYQQIGQPQKALEFFNQALPIHREAGDRSGEATTLNSLGSIYGEIGQPQKALEILNQALPIEREVGDRRSEAGTLNSLGSIYGQIGQPQKALEFYNQALPIEREVGDRRSEAATLTNIGLIHGEIGQPQKALELLNQALPIEREVGDRRSEAATLNILGSIYEQIGQPQKALEFYNQALPIDREVGDRSGEAKTLTNIGVIYGQTGQPQKALEFYNQALSITREAGDRNNEATTLTNIGVIYGQIGQPQKMLEFLNRALPILRVIGDRRGEAVALSNIGLIYIYGQIGRPQAAGDALQLCLAALQLAKIIGDPDLQGQINGEIMMYWAKKNVPLAIFFGKATVNNYQEIRGNMRGLDNGLQAGFAHSKSESYRYLAGLLADQGRLTEAEQVLNLLKETEYFEFVRRDSAESGALTQHADLTPAEAELEKRYREVGDKLVALGTERGAMLAKKDLTPEETKRLTQLDKDLQVGNAAFEKFLNDLAEQFGRAPAANARIEQVRETQGLMEDLRELPPGAVAVYTLVGEDKYRAILVTPDIQKAYEYPIKAADLNRKVLEFRQVLQDPKLDPRPLGQELYQIMVANLANDLVQAKAKTVMWSLDGALRYLPVAALYDGNHYLVEQYALSVFTPASNARLKDRPDQRWEGAGFGVTKAHEGAPALPGVAAELSGIIGQKTGQGGIMAGEIKLDDQFTEDAMRQTLLKHYTVVHIASHFMFQPGNETDSFLLLGDGNHLSLAELKSLPNLFGGVQLLTLSACSTGLGDTNEDGKEVEGLGVLSQRKGAKAVIASLWSVADISTSLLMQDFYRARESSAITKAEALRRAQLALLQGTLKTTGAGVVDPALMHESLVKEKQSKSPRFPLDPKIPYAHPYYWAPFFLMGNWL